MSSGTRLYYAALMVLWVAGGLVGGFLSGFAVDLLRDGLCR